MVLRRLTPGSYEVQNVLFLQGVGCPEKKYKSRRAFMDRISYMLCLQNYVGSTRDRLSRLDFSTENNPLDNMIGMHLFRKYEQRDKGEAITHQKFA